MGRTQIQSPDIASGAVSSLKLADSGVTLGTYILPTVTVNSKGIITGISGSGTVSPDQITPQGSGSGLNADLLDGKHAAEFSLLAHTHALSSLTDVTLASPTDGEVLTYSGGAWINQSPSVTGGVSDHGALSGLGDDDHTQYLTSPRANTWFGSKTTTDLAEGSNLYFTDERAQDVFGAMVSPSSTVRWSYNDSAGKIQAIVSPANISHALLSNLTVGDPHTQYQLESEKNAANGYAGLDSAGKISSPLLHSGVMIVYKSNSLSGSIVATSTGSIDVTAGALLLPFIAGTEAGAVWVDGEDLKYRDNDLVTVRTVEHLAHKNVAGGYAGLDGSGLVSPSRVPAMPLSFLSDVSPSGATNGQALMYHAASGQWRNQSPSSGVTDHGALTGLADDDHTQYHNDARAATWLGTRSIADLLDVSPSALIDGQVLTYDSPSGRWRNETIPSGVTDHGLLDGLGDDDHTQYHNDTRADTWFGTKTTGDLAEGANLYFTNERAQDVVGSMVSPSSTVRWSYDDAAGKITAIVSPANISHALLGDLVTGDPHTQYQLRSEKNTANGYMGLDSNGRGSPSRFGSGTANSTTYLRGDGSWQVISIPTPGDSITINSVAVTDADFNSTTPAAPANTVIIRWQRSGSNPTSVSAYVSPGVISHALLSNLTAGDPHTQYQLESEKNAVNGYAGLDSGGLVSPSRIPAMPLSFLSDVSPTAPSNNQVLTYHAASSRWRNASPATVITLHSSLAGLDSDDHPQYILQDGTRSFNDSALKLRDAVNSNDLTFAIPDLGGVDRTFTLEMFSGDRTLTLKGDVTLMGGSHDGTNTGDVTLAGALDYITLSNQVITRGPIDLTTDVTGDLPLSSLAQSGAASRLLGRGSAAGAGDYQDITLGSGLSIAGTTLSATGGSSALSDLTDVDLVSVSPIANDYLVYDGSVWYPAQLPQLTSEITVVIDGGGAVIQPYQIFYVPMAGYGAITGWTVIADQSGSIGFEIWKSTYAGAPPTSANRISGSPANAERPNLSSTQKNRDLNLATWSSADVTGGDMLAVYVQSPVTSVTRVTLMLRYRRTLI